MPADAASHAPLRMNARPHAEPLDATFIAQVIKEQVGRALLRNLKGFAYFASPAPAVGTTPKDLIFTRGTASLYHYRPRAEEIYRVPLLLVMAPTNRAYIFDLTPGQSLVEYLLVRGFDVYVLDWNPPRLDEKVLGLEQYVLGFIPECIRRIAERSGIAEISLIGYCMGGVLATMYAALDDELSLKNLVCLTTPIDFSHLEAFRRWTDPRHFDVDHLVESLGNVPPEFICEGMGLLRPAERLAGQLRLAERLWDDDYVIAFRRLNGWASDILPLPGRYFRQCIKALLWDNALVSGALRIAGRSVDLKRVRVPLLQVVAEHDHIVPRAASQVLNEAVGSADKTELVVKGGHVSVVAGAGATIRMWPALDCWLSERST